MIQAECIPIGVHVIRQRRDIACRAQRLDQSGALLGLDGMQLQQSVPASLELGIYLPGQHGRLLDDGCGQAGLGERRSQSVTQPVIHRICRGTGGLEAAHPSRYQRNRTSLAPPTR